ncbi:hypothetical protein [Leeuwenhoekiella sp. NPDC079379]|uniref:hypothetical protein n=1 Tax=Leeuwenhoekiella sp. NPDC079379 TaxID=3364122 RepID=UPI0037C96C4B
MKNLLIILILTLIYVSCKTERKTQLPKSDFSLKKDYVELTNKLTELDTIKVWMNLSQCTYQGIEKLTITRKKDSIKIQPEFAESMIVGTEFIKEKEIIISVNDTIWKFNEFLKRNENRSQSDSLKYGRLQITLNSEKLNFFTHGLGDSGKFLFDYCRTMKNIMPESDNHIFGVEIIEIEDGEMEETELESE